MSRRWFRYDQRMVFLGWDRDLGRYFVTLAELCDHCEGTGEEPGSDYFCSACHAEGVKHSVSAPASTAAASIQEIAEFLAGAGIPFPGYVRADLEADRAAPEHGVVHAYNL
ncbi:MAG: hypothetical protein U0821_03740 [Chloroflexota bacterium]